VNGTVKGDRVEFTNVPFFGEAVPMFKYRTGRTLYAGKWEGKAVEGQYRDVAEKSFYIASQFALRWQKQLSAAELRQRVQQRTEAARRLESELPAVKEQLASPAFAGYKLELGKPSWEGHPRVGFYGLKKPTAGGLTVKHLEGLKALKHFSHISLYEVKLRDEDLAVLGGFASINGISFSRVPISGVGLRHLRDKDRLQTLGLFDCPLTDEGLKEVGRLSGVEALSLSLKAPLTVEGLRHLVGLSRLRILRFSDKGEIPVAAVLEAIKGLRSLEQLEDYSPKVDEKALDALKDLPNLRAVSLGSLKGAWLSRLARIPTLESITLRGCDGLNDDCLAPLSALKKLNWLLLRGDYWVPSGNEVDYVRRLPSMSDEEKACYAVVRLLADLAERRADLAQIRQRAPVYFPSSEQGRQQGRQFIKEISDRQLTLHEGTQRAGRLALALAEKAFRADTKRSLTVWAMVYLFAGIETPGLSKHLTPEQWQSLRDRRRGLLLRSR
jgi:hypothetical protein